MVSQRLLSVCYDNLVDGWLPLVDTNDPRTCQCRLCSVLAKYRRVGGTLPIHSLPDVVLLLHGNLEMKIAVPGTLCLHRAGEPPHVYR